MTWTRRTFAPLGLAFLVSGCATQQNRGLAIPAEAERVYVAVFVDETEGGAVGLPLSEAVRSEIYRRAPNRLSSFFDGESLVIDGTVTSIEERLQADGSVLIEVQTTAQVRRRDGAALFVLGPVRAQSTFQPGGHPAGTADAPRREAIAAASKRLAHWLVDRLDAESRGGAS